MTSASSVVRHQKASRHVCSIQNSTARASPVKATTIGPKERIQVIIKTMHPHLHTEENQKNCADVIAALDECHARGFLHKMVGNCSDAKHKVNMCLRAQRIERTRLNREAAKEKRAHMESVWKQLDDEIGE